MSTKPIPKSARKLQNWAAIHALDVRARELQEQHGITREEAYTRAMDERDQREAEEREAKEREKR